MPHTSTHRETPVMLATGIVLCGPAWPGTQMHRWADSQMDRVQVLVQWAAASGKGSMQWIGHWRAQSPEDVWSHTVTQKQLSHLDNPTTGTCISQRTVFINGRRNSRCGLTLIWWWVEGLFVYGYFKGNGFVLEAHSSSKSVYTLYKKLFLSHQTFTTRMYERWTVEPHVADRQH